MVRSRRLAYRTKANSFLVESGQGRFDTPAKGVTFAC
jgi:hypothetical protein